MRSIIIGVSAVGLVAVMAGGALAAPGGVKGPPTPGVHTLEPCVFTDGVLDGWDGATDELFICAWDVRNRPQTFTFRMETVDGGTMRDPYLGVKDAFLPEGDFCFVSRPEGHWFTEATFGPFTLPEDGSCGDEWNDGDPDRFALMVTVEPPQKKYTYSGARLVLEASESPSSP